ncbi:choice-of-anchor Q domain-containing protein [Paraconexibacter algicola]|uniref:Uncharacterized protein n=1 Tax=Paraconexibacter algicola TaxID=2133960 RepID=A0A2T4UGW0_9ACTN|nr:choice-of-anchor Q domain-containing protein [Paraconexibacter algicola]PTL58496.1 hypothetical protein C7Y72_01910 [Paraconexibacter algicola]
MSQRSVRRAHRRRLDAATRREARLRRAGLTAGVVLGAAAVTAPAAHADTFVVTSTADPARWVGGERTQRAAEDELTLRDAIMRANGTDGADTITFASGLTGTIRLQSGPLTVRPGGLTITGPGSQVLTISGDADADGEASPGDTSLFSITADAALELSGITGSHGRSGDSGSKYAGAITVEPDATLDLHDAALTQNGRLTSESGPQEFTIGGAILTGGRTTVTRTTFSGNSGLFGGAIAQLPSTEDAQRPSSLTISDSSFSGNAGFVGGAVAGIGAAIKYAPDDRQRAAPLTVTTSTFTGNEAQAGGAILAAPAPDSDDLAITDSTFSANTADQGGAIAVQAGSASGPSGGLPGGGGTLDRNTFVDNTATDLGGGVAISGAADSALALTRSTFTGNQAGRGGAIAIPAQTPGPAPMARAAASTTGVALDALTVTGNRATERGGGIYLAPAQVPTQDGTTSAPGTQVLSSSIVAGNVVVEPLEQRAGRAPGDTTPDDLGQEPAGGPGDGFALRHSLVQAPIAAAYTTDPAAPSLLGVDPKLGALAPAGGPTATILPAADSPVIDAGRAAPGITSDQRGAPRPADQPGVADAVGGDGSDIGAVELPAPGTPPAPPSPQPQPAAPAAPVPPATIPTTPAGTTAVAPPAPFSRPGVLPARTRQPITLRGTAGRGTSKVRVSVARKVGKRCRFLLPGGTFSATRDCRRTLYVTAQGTTSWRLTLPKLPKGRYTVWSRAIVQGKLVERKKTSRNFRRFEVR